MTNNTPVKTILILAANPTNTAPLRLDREIREIDEGLRRANKRDQYKLEQKWAVRSRDFYRAILDCQPNIVHFCGHGAGEDGIVLEDDTGKMALVQTNALASMFKLFAKKGVECVILNACYSEVQAEAISQYVNYVIGMNRAVGDRAAVAFAVAFYDATAAGYGLEEAYELGCSQMMSFLEHETPVLKKRKLINAPIEDVAITFEDVIPPNPYQGLSAFGEKDADFFFGQEKFVSNLVEVTHKQPLVAVVGPSGSGKSSVVFAGLIPKLRKDGNWLIESFRPGKEPFVQLAFALVRQLEPAASETQQLREAVGLSGDLQNGRITLLQVISRILDRNPGKRLLLVADQFEELYTLCQVQEERKRFADALLTAIAQQNITFVVTLRADFYGHVLSYRPLRDALQEFTPQLLSSMKREELQQAIELPAQKSEVQLEPQLTQRILDDVGQEPGNLPLLEFALTRLWEKQKNRVLTHQAYEEIGGVKKAIANHAEQVYQKLNETEKKQAQRIFVQLVRPGEGTEDTRRVATRAEVGEDSWNLVSYLAGYPARLVVTGRQEQEDTVEVVHEALIREWGTFRDWINASRQFRTWQERLKVLLQDWKNNNYDTEGLLRGAPLSVAEDWLNKHPEQLRIEEQKFIQKSINREKREEIFKKFTFGLLTISLVFVTGLVFKNRYNFEIANLSMSSQLLLESNKEFEGLIEILKASNKLKPPFLSTTASRNSVILNLRKAVYETRELNRLEKHQDRVTSISFNKDGQILTSGYDKHLILWSPEGRLLQDFGEVHKDTIWKATFSPNGKIIASASKDKTVKIWSQQNGTWVLKSTLSHSHPVRVVKFSPNGEIIASSDDDSNIKLWSSDGQRLNSIKANQGWLLSMSFKDNQTLATGGSDSSVKFWRIQNGTFKDVELLGTLRGHGEKGVWSLDFSPNGKMLVTGGRDGTIKLWRKQAESKSNDWIRDLKFSLSKKVLDEICDNQLKKSENGIEYSCLKASKDYVRGVSFSPDNQIIAGGTWEKYIVLWYWDRPGMTSETLNGHGNGVWDVKFSSDGKILASASDDNTVKLWNTKETPQAFGEAESPILDVSFSPDGQRIASASQCKIVKQLDVNGNSINKDLVDVTLSQSPDPKCHNRTVRSHSEKVNEVAFSPLDGKMITASADCTIKLWNADGHLIKPLLIDASIETKNKKCSSKSSHSQAVQGVAFSPDGKNIASASLDNTIKLWNTQDGSLIKKFKNQYGVDKVRFSPDGKTLVSASADHTVRLWSTNDASNVKILSGHTKRVRDVSFSPDGKIIASVSWDHTIKLWNKDGTLRKTIYGHSAEVESVSFSSDGQMIASASRDRKIKIWNLDGILINSIDIYKGEIYSVSFSPQDKFLVAGVDDGQVRLWDIELNNLQAKACNHLKNYLQNNPNSIESENQHLCDRVEPSATAFFLHGEQLALQGRIDDAIANFEKAVKLDSNLIYLASDWNKLCWMGSLNQQPQKFIVACDKAVQLEPKNGWIRKSRGVARALIGNFNGAVEDFEESIKLITDENEKTKQKDWIESLKKAKNPFTNEVLENFRSE